jgi:hypothetical protein
MRVSTLTTIVCAALCVGGAANKTAAQSPEAIRVATVYPSAEKSTKFTFLLFWRENDAATQAAHTALKAAVEKRSERAEWKAVNVTDPTNRAIVDQYHVDRAPMPIAICVAHNGAITGAMPRQITDHGVEHALATPAMVEATGALENKKIVLIHVKRDAGQQLPAGAAEFLADPAFSQRSITVGVGLDDKTENRFVNEMQIKPAEVSDSMIVLLAPPGVMVGKFPASATGGQIAAALHAAGKCCNDPNCKHNQPAK